jgi:hypothetical protein
LTFLIQNVKIALSVATVNMGVVDAYVNVKDSNMNIELKCDPKWVKVFDMSKNKLASTLSGSIYAISIVVNPLTDFLGNPIIKGISFPLITLAGVTIRFCVSEGSLRFILG